MTAWTRIADGLPPAGQLVRIAHVPPGWTVIRCSRGMISQTDGTWVLDRATRAACGTITHWAVEEDIDEGELDWALAYARQQEAAA